jgi:hypothetical protein
LTYTIYWGNIYRNTQGIILPKAAKTLQTKGFMVFLKDARFWERAPRLDRRV